MQSYPRQIQAIDSQGKRIALALRYAKIGSGDEEQCESKAFHCNSYVLDHNLAIIDPSIGYTKGGYSYPRNWREHPRVKPSGRGRAEVTLGAIQKLPGKSLMLGALHHYGHFYTDTLSRCRKENKHDWYISNTKPSLEWLRLISHFTGIDSCDLRNKLIVPPAGGCLQPEELICHPIRCSKTYFDQKTISELRKYADLAGSRAGQGTEKRLIVTRRHANRRRLLLETGAIHALARKGIREVIPEKMSLQEQIQLFGNAEEIILPAGSECYNLCYCKPGTRVCVAISETYLLGGGDFGFHIQSLCLNAGLDLVFLMCREFLGSSNRGDHNSDIIATTEQLLQSI